MVMDILIAKCIKKIDATQYAYIRLNADRCRSASTSIRNINPKYNSTSAVLPRKPNCSPMAQKIKSVFCSGTNSFLVDVPFRKPLPVSPPEPIAIFDCHTLYPDIVLLPYPCLQVPGIHPARFAPAWYIFSLPGVFAIHF